MSDYRGIEFIDEEHDRIKAECDRVSENMPNMSPIEIMESMSNLFASSVMAAFDSLMMNVADKEPEVFERLFMATYRKVLAELNERKDRKDSYYLNNGDEINIE